MSAEKAPATAARAEQAGQVVAPAQAHTVQPDQYALRDLHAQENMAFWAMLTFYAAAVSAMVALLALVGIIVDLTLNRRRAKVDQRPWLTLKAELCTSVQLGDTEVLGNQSLKFRFNVTIKNVGSTPARKAYLKGKMFNTLRGGDAAERFIGECLAEATASQEAGFVLGPNEEITKFYQMALPSAEFGVNPNAQGRATYPMAVFSVCYGATSDPALRAQTAKGILFHYADWIDGGFHFATTEIEEIQSGEANNIGTAT